MKKIMLLIIMFFPLMVLASVLGDIDGDGNVGSSDYILVRKHLLGQGKLTGDRYTRADANNDGNITSADYIEIRKMIINGKAVTPTIVPTKSATQNPTATATSKPTATATSKPTVTATIKPNATSKSTATQKPTATTTSKPTATQKPTTTATSKPTATQKPTATATSKPTATQKPTATATSKPTATQKPTVTPIPVSSVSLNKNELILEVGEGGLLTATIQPSNAANKTLKWSSSNSEIVDVSSDGIIKGMKYGEATITVKTDDGGKSATCKVKVLSIEEKICESVKNNSSIDYKSFASLQRDNDDYYIIKAAHDCANKYKLPVKLTKNSTYHIYKRIRLGGSQISVRTNTDFNGSTIYIHDEILRYDSSKKELNYEGAIYRIAPDEKSCNTIDIKNKNNFDALISTINNSNSDVRKYVKLTDKSGDAKNVFKRSGNLKKSDENKKGDPRSDAFIMVNGKISSDYNKFFWERNSYITNSSAMICSIPSKQLTFQNAIFKTIIGEDSSLANMKDYANRGINIERSNTKLDNLMHLYITIDGSNQEKLVRYTTYEHRAFYLFMNVADITFSNSVVYALKVKGNNNGVSSTYDFGINDVINMTVNNVKMYNNDVHNSLYKNSNVFLDTFNNDPNGQLTADLWGVMGANRVKYITFNNCSLNRIDAHRGILILNVSNSTLGRFSINVTGAGDYFNNEMHLNKVTVKGNPNDSFITLRGDYGSTWNGYIYIKECTFDDAPSSDKKTGYLINWNGSDDFDYGYEIYLPRVQIDGLKITDNGFSKFYIFNQSKKYFTDLDNKTGYRFTNEYWSNSSGKNTITHGDNLTVIGDYIP